MKKFLSVLMVLVSSLVITVGLPGQSFASHNDQHWAVGNLVDLCTGTEIRHGPGLIYGIHTRVPVDDWTVKVIGGPSFANGQTWWDTSRRDAGDPSGGTGWVSQQQAPTNCVDGGGGGGGGGEGGGGGGDDGDGGGGGPPPYVSQDLTSIDKCDAETPPGIGQVDDENGRHFYIEFVIPNSTGTNKVVMDDTTQMAHVVITNPILALAARGGFQVGPFRIGSRTFGPYTVPGGPLRVNGPGANEGFEGRTTKVLDDHWHVFIHEGLVHLEIQILGRNVEVAPLHNEYTNNPGSLVHLLCNYKLQTGPDRFYYPLLNGVAIAAPQVGEQYAYNFNFPSWMTSSTVILRKGSDATITLRGPDGTIYDASHPNVEYINTSQYAVLKLNQPPAGQWEALIDVTAAQPDSVFFLNIGGTYGNGTNTDTFAPFTNFTIEATHGNNSWLVSDARITLSAEDSGGSGVAKIEWSVNEGASWNNYSAPIIISQEGLTVFTARATDNAGNVEILPPTKYLRIDKTSPVTTLALEGTQGNNGWFVSNVSGSLSATDNMSGLDATYYSIDGGAVVAGTTPMFETDGIHTIQFYSQDRAGNIEPSQAVIVKVDKTPPVVIVSTDQPEYTRVQPFIVRYSGYDPEPGSGLATLTAVFNNQPVTNGQIIDLFWLPLGQYTLTATAEDNAGWTTTNSASFELIATLSSLKATLGRLCTEVYITDKGICNSLNRKLDAALSAQARGNTTPIVGILGAFKNEVEAQSAKKISPPATWLLTEDANYVLIHLQ